MRDDDPNPKVSEDKPESPGVSRRDFLKVGALGATGLLLPDLLRGRALASARGQAASERSVIWLTPDL